MIQEALEMFAKILDEVIAIRDLSGMRQDLTHRIGKGAGPIPADHLNFWMTGEPGLDGLSRAIRQEIEWPSRLKVDENRSVGVCPSEGSGEGNGVAAIPSPKNRTGRFLYIRLKPFSPPVSPDAVSQRVNPGCELVGGTWDGAELGFLPHLIPLLIAI